MSNTNGSGNKKSVASIKNLEKQLGQLAQAHNLKHQEDFPSEMKNPM